MRRTREYRDIFFTPESIRKGFAFFDRCLLSDLHKQYLVKEFVIELSDLLWEYDTEEKLFKAYIPAVTTIIYKKTFLDYEFMLYTADHSTYVGLKAQTLAKMVPIFEFIDTLIPSEALTREQALKRTNPLVLILHGKSEDWKELVSYLYQTHGYAVRPYDLDHCRIDHIRGLVEISGCVVAFVLLDQGFKEIEEREQLLASLKDLMMGKGLSIICPSQREKETLVYDGQIIFFRPGRIKEIFWLVVDKIRRSYMNSENHDPI